MNDEIESKHHRCTTCSADKNGYCDEHKLSMAQLKILEGIPSAVSKMTGVLGIIGTLFTLLVGLLFNAHFESKKNNETYSTKIDSLSTQIAKLENENTKAILNVKSDILKITLTLEQIERDSAIFRQTMIDKTSKK